jgi:hypothetical protein
MSPMEQHHSISAIAQRWSLDEKTVREIFRAEPGVIKIERPDRRSKRSYTTLRIPESVLAAVYRRMRN